MIFVIIGAFAGLALGDAYDRLFAGFLLGIAVGCLFGFLVKT